MGRFDSIRNNIPNAESLRRLSTSEVEILRSRHPGLSEDYLEFLREVGFGNLGKIQLYSRPTSAGSVYSPMPKHLQQILLIGDDMQGYCFGFDTDNGFRLVEISPKGTIEPGVESEFTGFLRGCFG